MTYCIGIRLNAGLVFLSDSRTNAGIDQISTFRKMIVYEKPDDRFMVLLSAGNLSISQSVREILQLEQIDRGPDLPALTIWNAESMFDAARVVGSAAKCALVSMDSTLKSNLSVGLPLDLLVYQEGQFATEQIVCIDDQNPYFQMIHSTWGQRLREVFEGIADPVWDGGASKQPLLADKARYEPMRKITRPEERVV